MSDVIEINQRCFSSFNTLVNGLYTDRGKIMYAPEHGAGSCRAGCYGRVRSFLSSISALLISPLLSFRLRNDLYCVGWGVKLYSLTHSLTPLLSNWGKKSALQIPQHGFSDLSLNSLLHLPPPHDSTLGYWPW